MPVPIHRKLRALSFKWIYALTFAVSVIITGSFLCPASAGYHPHHSFIANGSWRFSNFSTSELEPETYFAAFNFRLIDYLNPITAIIYVAGKDLADGGNCFGMCILANKGESSNGTVSTRFSGNLSEDFFSNHPNRNNNLDLDINTYHWQQYSTEFLLRWRLGIRESAQQNAARMDEDVAAGRYGVITIYHGGRGHALIPLHVGGTTENIDVVVYDPNLPRNESSGNTLVINRTTGDWRYHTAWNATAGWHDTWTGSDSEISYVTYTGSPGWTGLVNDPLDLIVIAGKNTHVEQVTDQRGRKLYKRLPARGLDDVDFSENGLGLDVIPWVPLKAQNPGAISPSGPRAVLPQRPTAPLPVGITASPHTQAMNVFKTMSDRYASAYEGDSKIFFVLNKNLTLNFDVTPRAKKGIKTLKHNAPTMARPVPPYARRSVSRADKIESLNLVVGNRLNTVEIKFTPDNSGDVIKPRTTIQVRDPSLKIQMSARSEASMAAELTISNINLKKHEVRFESTESLPVRDSSKTIVRRSKSGRYRISGPRLSTTAKIIQRESIRQDGLVRRLPPIKARTREFR